MPEQTTKPDSKSYHNGVQDTTITNLGDVVKDIKEDMKAGFAAMGAKIDTFQADVSKIKTTARVAYIIGGILGGILIVLLGVSATVAAAYIGK